MNYYVKKISFGLSKNLKLQIMHLQFIYIWYIHLHKEDLAWNNPWEFDIPLNPTNLVVSS